MKVGEKLFPWINGNVVEKSSMLCNVAEACLDVLSFSITRAVEGNHTHFEVSADLDENGHWYYTNIFVKK